MELYGIEGDGGRERWMVRVIDKRRKRWWSREEERERGRGGGGGGSVGEV